MQVLFKTLTGSRLYGLAHDKSDYDYFTVVDKVKTNRIKYSTHKIVDGVDSVVVDFGTFMNGIRSGTPQYLEACFSTIASEDHIKALRSAVHVGSEVFPTYLRTIKSLAMQEDFKTKRHALRLAYDMADLRRYGRFEPHMKPEHIYLSTVLASMNDSEQVYNYAIDIAWS